MCQDSLLGLLPLSGRLALLLPRMDAQLAGGALVVLCHFDAREFAVEHVLQVQGRVEFLDPV